MKLENLQRANDLAQQKASTIRFLQDNLEALKFMETYSLEKQVYPFDSDLTYQTSPSPNKDTKFMVKHRLLEGHGFNHYHDTQFRLPLDLVIKAVKEENKRLQARLEEIDKEIEGL